MTQRRCVELTAVYDDGQVERWEGDAADNVIEEFYSGVDCTLYNRCCTLEEENDVKATVVPTTIIKPLRRVTEIDADYLTGDRHDPDGFFYLGEPWANMDQRFVPDEVCGTPGVIRRFRIVVEAVPVESK